MRAAAAVAATADEKQILKQLVALKRQFVL